MKRIFFVFPAIAIGLWGGVSLLLVSGCRPAPTTEVTIHWATNGHPSRQDAANWFERENPGIRVVLQPISEPRQFFLQCLFGEAPDVITFFQVDAFQSFARNGLLLSLGDECVGARSYDQGNASVMAWPYYNGLKPYCFALENNALMALPQVAYPYVLYYDRRFISDAKAGAVDSWEALFKLLSEMTPRVNSWKNGSKDGKQIFGLDIQSDFIWFSTWYRQQGGRFFSKDGACVLDYEKTVETLESMASWRRAEGILPRPWDRLNLPSRGASQGVLGSLFLQGRAIFYWSGSWKIADFETQQNVSWGVRPLPRGAVNGATILGGNSFGVSCRSKYPDEAKRFVRYLSGPRAQMRHMAHGIYLPAHKGCPIPPQYEVLKDQAMTSVTMDYSPRINESLQKEIFKQALDAHRLGVSDARETATLLIRSLSSGSVERFNE